MTPQQIVSEDRRTTKSPERKKDETTRPNQMPDKPNFEARVGLFTVIAVLMLMYGWSWLHGLSIFHPPQLFVVEFHDVAGLNNNATVQVNGVRVGTVNKLTLIKKGLVEVELKINTEGDFAIPEKSLFTIQTVGLVGAKYVEVTLPDDQAHMTKIAQGEHVKGEDPVRVELVMNKLGTSLGKIDFAGVEGRLSTNMERLAKAADSVQTAADRFGGISDDAKGAAKSANQFFARGTSSFDRIDEVANNSHGALRQFTSTAQDWDTTSRKLNRILDNPALAGDLKETMAKAQATAQSIQSSVHELTSMVQNSQNKQDLLLALQRLSDSTENVKKSVQVVQTLAGDKGMRTELRQMLSDARQTMDKVDTVMAQPMFGPDLRNAINNVNTAAIDLDAVTKQMHKVMQEKRPLLKMMFGRPGYIKEEKKAEKAAAVKKDMVAVPPQPAPKDRTTGGASNSNPGSVLSPINPDADPNANAGSKEPQQ
jgi:phospholipid/cholesterol/gamma-HCH transport system substrate-binding protein